MSKIKSNLYLRNLSTFRLLPKSNSWVGEDIRKVVSKKQRSFYRNPGFLGGGYILVTRNENDFRNLGLEIYNPFRET
jgi:hypothetical protein